MNGKEWLVKFRAKRDSKQIGEDEYCYSLLAKECGIEMPETRLFEDKYFGVERFDRILNGKLHVVSVAGWIVLIIGCQVSTTYISLRCVQH